MMDPPEGPKPGPEPKLHLALHHETARIPALVAEGNGVDPDLPWVGDSEIKFVPRTNITPRTKVLVLLRWNGRLMLQTMTWGLSASYHVVRDPMRNPLTIRGRDIANHIYHWQTHLKEQRCVVIVHGYYVMPTKGKGKSEIVHFVRRQDEKPLLLAGFFDSATLLPSDAGAVADPVYSVTLVTSESCPQLSGTHQRQPVVITPGASRDAWLSQASWSDDLHRDIVLRSHQNDNLPLVTYRVSRHVRDVEKQTPTFIVRQHMDLATVFTQKASQQQQTGTGGVAPAAEALPAASTSAQVPALPPNDRESVLSYQSVDDEMQRFQIAAPAASTSGARVQARPEGSRKGKEVQWRSFTPSSVSGTNEPGTPTTPGSRQSQLPSTPPRRGLSPPNPICIDVDEGREGFQRQLPSPPATDVKGKQAKRPIETLTDEETESWSTEESPGPRRKRAKLTGIAGPSILEPPQGRL